MFTIPDSRKPEVLRTQIRGRVLHGRHFTWRCGSRAVTVLPPGLPGAIPTNHQPYAARGQWMQILLPKHLAMDISKKVSSFETLAETDSESDSGDEERKREPIMLPLTLFWPEFNLKITIVQELDVL
ncbi:hypothetical protein evm_009270 [Chilo suppressalis]|nr:hypothetical protein evm_009270 [Chilo suppressalis]